MTDNATTEQIFQREKRLADIRQRRDLEKLDEPIKSDGWQNLYFKTTGESCLGSKIHPSEATAKAGADEFFRKCSEVASEWGEDALCKDPVTGDIFTADEYSHAIQIPMLP